MKIPCMCLKNSTIHIGEWGQWGIGQVPRGSLALAQRFIFFSLYELNEVKVNLRGGLENKEQKEV